MNTLLLDRVLPLCLCDHSTLYHGYVGLTGRHVFYCDFPGDGEPRLCRDGRLPDMQGSTATQYEWGGGIADQLGGPGLALARALLRHAMDESAAQTRGVQFFLEVVRRLPSDHWSLTRRQICAWATAAAYGAKVVAHG